MSNRVFAYQRLGAAVSRLETAANRRLDAVGKAADSQRDVQRLSEERNRLAHDSQKMSDVAGAVEDRLNRTIARLGKILEDS